MKKTKHLFSLLALGLGLALSLGSCKDNDLADGGSNGGDGTEQNEALAQKYQALQTLLGSLASVDSLPSNWNSDTYTVSPTIGLVKDEAEPHVRYVVTTSQAEADRLYRSYLSKDVTGTPTDDSWQMPGIGSLQFHLENSDNLYATLRVNVKQLPALEEIRFVSEDYLGSNGMIAPSGTYYSFGDVVFQDVTGVDEQGHKVSTPTFWVCVRPCSTSPKRRQSHWCTFQLVPYGDENLQNYLKVGNDNYLPTRLAFNKSDAERQVQNFFNVLRIMANPRVTLDGDYEGIDDISTSNNKNTGATFNVLRNTSFMWDYLDLWNPNLKLSKNIDGKDINLTGGVVNKAFEEYVENDDENADENDDESSEDENDDENDDESSEDEQQVSPYRMKNLLSKKSGLLSVDAFYNGYSTNYFSKGDYTVYNLHLTAEKEGPFLNVKKQTAYVNNSEAYDFRKLVSGNPADVPNVHFSTDRSNYQFVVKYRTGAELEGNGASHSAIDVDPAQSFEERKAQNQITDVLVSGHWQERWRYKKADNNTYDESVLPFFAFGDKVTSLNLSYYSGQNKGEFLYNTNIYCIRDAYPTYSKFNVNGHDLTRWTKEAIFVKPADQSIKFDKVVEPNNADVAAFFHSVLLAYIQNNVEVREFLEQPAEEINQNKEIGKRLYYEALKRLYDEIFGKNVNFKTQHTTTDIDGVETRVHRVYLQVQINTGRYYGFIYETDNKNHTQYQLVKSDKAFLPNNNITYYPVYFFNYDDGYAMKETFSINRTLFAKTKKEREALRAYASEQLKAKMMQTSF